MSRIAASPASFIGRPVVRYGLGMVELLLGLMLGALVVVGALHAYDKSRETQAVTDAIEEVTYIVGKCHAVTASDNQARCFPSTLALMPDTPKKWLSSNASLMKTSAGGIVGFQGEPGSGTLYLYISNLGRQSCIMLTEADWSTLAADVNVNYTIDSGGAPFTPAQANTNCLDGGENVLYFNLKY